MKTVYFFTVIIVLLAGCQLHKLSPKNFQTFSINLLLDITDKKMIWPTANSILNAFNCAASPNASYRFKLSIISDKVHNETFSCELPNSEETERDNELDDPQYRSKRINAFYQDVRNI